MANKNILTYNLKVGQIEQAYYAPVATIPNTNPPIAISTLFCFLSRIDPWGDDNDPEQPTQDQKYIKGVFKNMFVAKQIKSTDISPVTERIDWTTGTMYNFYRDDIDMFEIGDNGLLVNKFYVRNRYDQVFKCLWNNNDGLSTEEPFFQPGSYSTNNIYTGTDGYKWKYMYTIDVGTKRKFMDATWMPIPVGQNTPNPVQTNVSTGIVPGCGDIEVINVTNGGSGYDPANSTITVTVTGDGYGATGSVVVDGDKITDVVVTNVGANYTTASVSITSGLGSGATAIASASPIGGHALDPVSELGASHVMFTCEFDGNEGGYIPTDIDYRQVGLLINPIAQSSGVNPANSSIYKTTTDLVIAAGFGEYVSDEFVYQGTSLEAATFIGTVLSFDVASNVVKLINTTGTPTLNAPVFGVISKTARTVLNVSYPDFITFSGYLAHIQNRSGVQRSFDGIEQFRFVLGY